MKKAIFILAGLVLLTHKIQAQSVTDYDGNVYNTVSIGTQVWMKENLKVTHYTNGDNVTNISDGDAWANLTTGARCYLYNDSVTYAPVYGALYNWFAVNDNRKLCPAGWHVPSDAELNILVIYLDHTVDTTAMDWSGTDIGGKLKEAGTLHWNFPNIGATNTSGFSALPAGGRGFNGLFGGLGETEDWWSSTAYDDTTALKRYLHYYTAQIERSNWYKTCGFSVRCVFDSLATGIDEGSIIDEPMRVYPNPTSGIIQLSGYSGASFNISVFDIAGRNVFSQKGEPGRNINMSELENGIYLIKIQSGDNDIVNQELIINR